MKSSRGAVGSVNAEGAYYRHQDAKKDHQEEAPAEVARNMFEEESPETVQVETSARQGEINQKAQDVSQV
jgi:hypothetical protein